ncbi:MAG: hypothetical protein ACRCVJ_00885 [Clostridium sp.]|uniref:hypothetical protein n=1 Tax=Clostridium sp. TaxID=1506 RepID=UPI003F30AF6F
MKNRFKKSLIYQWLYTTKWAIILAVVVWTLYCIFVIYDSKINALKYDIGILTTDRINHISMIDNICFIGIIIFVYLMSNGLNKRSKITLINSGPYTRKDIFFNNLLCNLSVMLILILIYIYISICFSIKYSDLLQYCSNFYFMILLDVLKFFSFGILAIAYTLLIDILFSNSIVTILAIGCLPISILTTIVFNIELVNRYIGFNTKSNKILDSLFMYIDFSVNNEHYPPNYNNFAIISFFIIVISIIILYIVKLLNEKVQFENVSNFFIFSYAKYISIVILSLGIGSTITFVISNYLFGYELFYIKFLFISIIIEVIMFIISCIILNNIISRFGK